MAKRYVPLAIAYDFDGTLAPGNMQEYEFVPKIGMKTPAFWAEVRQISQENQADPILVYMNLMLEKARAARVQVRCADIQAFGESVTLFQGVEDWFDRINSYGKSGGVQVQHFIISSGIREMIQGTSIAHQFTKIFASAFLYDHHGIAYWPASAVNYTTKTQFLFRINKGVHDVSDAQGVNAYVAAGKRPVPFANMIFIGDGETDIPCFKLVKEQTGHAIAVFRPHKGQAKGTAQKLVADGRVDYVAPADYREDGRMDAIVKAIIDKIRAVASLRQLAKAD